MNTQNFRIKRGAEPILLLGGEVGCVCTHGFTASPEEMRWLSEFLHGKGLTVFAPRLAGHGTDINLMRQQHWLDWYESVLDAVALVRARCQRVYAVGLSMGGLLSLRVAAAGLVDGVAALAAPVFVNQKLFHLAPLIQYVKRYHYGGDPTNLDPRVREIQRETGREDWGRLAYDSLPVASMVQLKNLMQDVDQHLPEITVPLMLVYSTNDQTAPYANMAHIAGRVSSASITQHTLERSPHVLTQDIERETVYEMVWDFINAQG